jgi:tetratricopeptide (TPR) repeat protein
VSRYGVQEAAKLIGLPEATIRTLVRAGFVSPERGPHNAWRFSFQDLIVLRTAQALAKARIPARRVMRSMKALRSRLPESMPLSGLSICADGDKVVVREGRQRWQADSGQYLLAFEADPRDGSLSLVPQERKQGEPSSAQWLERALALESADARAAIKAYRRALAAEPSLLEARINLGRLLHDTGHLAEAERIYRGAGEEGARDARLLYNLGVLLEDMERKEDALAAYQSALDVDPRFADCCYNLALLFESLGRPREAIRYMGQYRRLTRSGK